MNPNTTALSQTLLAAKGAKDLTWDALGAALGKSPVWVASACLGMNSMPAADAEALCQVLGLDASIAAQLQQYPTKVWTQAIPTDPLIYRLYEVVGVYGDTIKAVIQEKFGDGIMSAIDFSMEIDKIEDPKGDRVLLTLNGKFLPYKTW
ncbi:MAG: cyanase [Pseudomonadota bacterium]|nr:cyanase [Pseudomonadota bacterium]